MIGRTPGEIIGKPRKVLFPGPVAARQYQSLQRVFSTGNPLRIESSIPLPSGDTWQDTHLVPLKAPDGSVTAVLGISRDITRFRQAQEALKRSNEKLNLLNSITRHDVANQLTILHGYIQLARMQEPDTVVGDFLKKIEAASDTIQRQIEFTRAYQDLGVRAPDWFRLDEILARTRPAGLVFMSLCNHCEIFADPMLEKVFFNLFDNALRHGERVTSIAVRCEQAEGELQITIEDDGIGIPLDQKQKIFQKGFGKNTGYGLFLVREILAITGIQIHETGRYGSGARFEISVPRGGYRRAPLLPADKSD
jgi:signal transduction histidine kinase